MTGGLAPVTRRWYEEHILQVLRREGRVTIGTLVSELEKMTGPGQGTKGGIPIQKERIVAFLRYLQAIGLVEYHRSKDKRISSKWGARCEKMS